MLPERYEQVWLSAVRPTLVRKVNAADRRQPAELIELDGGDLWRGPPLVNAHQAVDGTVPRASLHGQNHITSLALSCGRGN